MLRIQTKEDVDRHVEDIFRKLETVNERNLRSYNIAKMYYQIGEYESARGYIANYLEVRDERSEAQEFLGQILEELGMEEEALNKYIVALELEVKQVDLPLRVCELLADTDMRIDPNRIRYWVERADQQFPHHPVVFRLKEKLLTMEKSNDNCEDLEALIASELSARPADVDLRVKLLKLYIEKQRHEDAYNHAVNFETAYSHTNNIMWYQALCELLKLYRKKKEHDWSFWVLYVSSLERYAALSLKEKSEKMRKSLSEVTQAVFDFDQALTQFKSGDFNEHSSFAEPMLLHMWAQLHFHLACLILRKIQHEEGSWRDARRLCGPLFLCAVQTSPLDPSAAWAIDPKDQLKGLVSLWYKEGSYRCSQAGHILQDFSKSNPKKVLKNIEKFCTETWHERIYKRVFTSLMYQEGIQTSYFTNNIAENPQLCLLSQSELKKYDEVSEEVWSESLHYQIWLGLQPLSLTNFTSDKQSTPVTSPIPPAASMKTTTTSATLKSETTVSSTTASTTVTSKSEVPLSELFKPPVDSWNCDACCVRNNGSQNDCVACGNQKDSSVTPKSKANNFQLDASASVGSVPTFTFGILQNANKDTGKKFTIGVSPVNDKASIHVPKSNASLSKADRGGVKCEFGSHHNTSGNSKQDTHFVFGSPRASFNFDFKSPTKSSDADDQSNEIVKSENNVSFGSPLPDKIEVKTGEEDEEVLYSHRAKLFRFDKSEKEWKERGLGSIKLLKHKETGKLRMVMRRNQIFKICLNHFVSPDLEFTLKDERTWLWSAANFNNEEIEYNQFACRFKTSEIAQEFKEAVDNARSNAKSIGAEGKTTKKKSENIATKVDDSAASGDIEIVYEAKPTKTENVASKELMLPPNFYAYKQKLDCSGCRGCREPEIPVFKLSRTQKFLERSKKSLDNVRESNGVPAVGAALKTTVFEKSENKLADNIKTFNYSSVLLEKSENLKKPNSEFKEQSLLTENLQNWSPFIAETKQITPTTNISMGQTIFGTTTSTKASGSMQDVFGSASSNLDQSKPPTDSATAEISSFESPSMGLGFF